MYDIFSLFLFSLPFFLSVLLPVLSHGLPQKLAEQQEINNLAQRRMTVDEERTLMKEELTALHEELFNKNEELKVGGTNFLWQYGPHSQRFSLQCDSEHKCPVVLATGTRMI